MTVITDRDMRIQVRETLGTDAIDHDIRAIVEEIQKRHGTVNIDTVPTAEYWEIVASHALR